MAAAVVKAFFIQQRDTFPNDISQYELHFLLLKNLIVENSPFGNRVNQMKILKRRKMMYSLKSMNACL